MSTTINSYSVALGLNADGLIDGTRLARGEARELDKTFKSLVNPMEKVQRQLDLLEKAVDQGAIRESVYRESVRRLTGTLQDNTAAIEAKSNALRRDNQLIAEGERLTKSLMTVEERHAQEIRRLKRLRDSQAIGETTYQRGIAAANNRLADSRIVTASVVRTPPTVRDAIRPQIPGQGVAAAGAAALSSRLTNLAAGYIGVYSAANFASGAIRRAADVERAVVSYEALTGSAEQAQNILQGVKDLASKGIDPTALHQSAQTMLSFNVAAQDVLPSLTAIGAITGGDTMRLERLSLAFAQVASNGRLMGEEVNQMVEAGFNPLQEISRTTGISIADLRKQMADGQISFQMVKDAFISVTSEGGRFHGRLESITDTLAGTINMAKASYAAFQESFGKEIAPAVKELATDFREATTQGSALLSLTRELSQGFADLGESLKSWTGKGIVGTTTSGLGFAATIGSQVRSTLFNSFSLGKDIGSGDFGAVREKLFGKIDAFLDQDTKATQVVAGGAAEAAAAQAIASEPSAAGVAATYNRLQASIESAQAAAIPTLTALQKEVEQRQRIAELAKERDSLESEAGRIREQALEPAERLARSIADIERMQQLGMINGFEANRARQEAIRESAKDIKIEQPQSMEVGSAEAYKFITGLQNEKDNALLKKAEEQRLLALAQLRQAELQNQKLDKIAEVSPRRAR